MHAGEGWALTGFLIAAVGCAAGRGDTAAAATSSSVGSGGAATSTTSSGTAGGLSTGGGSSVPGCADGADDVFVLGFDLEKPVLYRFHPPTLAFDELGPVTGCPAGTGFAGKNPWAAALARDAVLWTHYLEWDHDLQQFVYDRVHTIDTTTGACSDAGAGLVHPNGKVVEYGMAFVVDPSDPEVDILYASAMHTPSFAGVELATVDLTTMGLATVGPLADTYHSFLTSTGEGKLFTLFRNPDNGLRELDPATGASISDQPITGLNSSQGPFVFWGGELWAFWMKTYDPQLLETDVYKIDPTTMQAEKMMTVNFAVTAATVSTCAPLAVPK